MKTSKIPFYHVRPSCFKVPANTGPQNLDTLVIFYFLSNLQFEFLATKTVMTNHHRLFKELSAGILCVAERYKTRQKWEKKGIKSSLSLIQYSSKDPELPGFLRLSFSLPGGQCSKKWTRNSYGFLHCKACLFFISLLPLLTTSKWILLVCGQNSFKYGRIKVVFSIAVSLLCVNEYPENLLKILNKKIKMHSIYHLKINLMTDGCIQLIYLSIPPSLAPYCVMPF